MQARQTALIIGVGVFVVVGNIIGQYAVQRHFEARRLTGGDAKPSDVSSPPSLFDLPAPRNLGDLSLTTFPEDVPDRSAALASSAGESDPAIDTDRHIQNIDGDSPFTLSSGLPASPARLEATEDARPIARGKASSVIRAIVEQELPDATDEERDIWAEELQGMPAAAMRNVLRLRRNSGTQLSFNTGSTSNTSRLKPSQKAECPQARTPSCVGCASPTIR